ncbi:MAG TPA: asparagine synthase-related protein, partial [Acidimicrobiales bacterium]|nr:asparagine synthase-related protein [Acidimicrobiales bacterium]
MAGVAGSYQQVDGELVARMMSGCLAHRGPDDNGTYSFSDERVSVHLTHRRLYVLDHAGGHQPFVKNGTALAYDGKLYNSRELRSELAASGARFATSSDAELVVEAWLRWGPGCLRKFRGMFAFAIFDERHGALFLARDHLGIKPMHYMCRKDGVVFASELKALVAAFAGEIQIEPAGMVAALLLGWVPDRRSAVFGPEKIEPGTWVEFRPDGSRRARRYFDAAEMAAAANAGPPVDLIETLRESVAAELVGDVPISSLLSGGPGSGLVAVMAKQANPEVDAYTLAFPAEGRRGSSMGNGTTVARRLARRHSIELHEVRLAQDVASMVPALAEVLDEPTGGPAALGTLVLCQVARRSGAKVLLSGLGGRELLGA